VSDFRAKYKTTPSFYGAQAYDAANLINSAVVATKGDVSNKDDLIKEMKMANFASVRGALRYGNNHFPIENFYLEQVAKGADGALGLKTIATIVENSQDKFHEKCPMN
jgi:branched-chain amino acid transport system substrate-binding protein